MAHKSSEHQSVDVPKKHQKNNKKETMKSYWQLKEELNRVNRSHQAAVSRANNYKKLYDKLIVEIDGNYSAYKEIMFSTEREKIKLQTRLDRIPKWIQYFFR